MPNFNSYTVMLFSSVKVFFPFGFWKTIIAISYSSMKFDLKNWFSEFSDLIIEMIYLMQRYIYFTARF